MTSPSSHVGQTIDLSIETLGTHGEGIGHWQGYIIYVEGALPKETVRVVLYETKKNYGRARIVERLTTSPHRVHPPCPVFGRCGGCQIMHLDYSQQLALKRQRIIDALDRAGIKIDVLPCEPSPSALSYRNKIQLPCASGTSTIHLGLYALGTHDVVEIERCYVHCELGERAFHHVKKLLAASSLTSYNAQTGKGELKYLLIKTAVNTEQVLVTLVTHTEGAISQALAQEILDGSPEIQGVVQNINPAPGNVILGKEFRTLVGKSAIEETLSGLTFKVSSASFFQVNPAQAEKLYQKALQYCDLKGDETVLDAYCGVGTLSLILSKQAKSVIGVECVPEAINDAKENAQRNGITNTQFFCAQAEDFLPTLRNIDIATLNPPRKGCEAKFLEGLALLAPKRIVYISCDPTTLARDLAILHTKGYQIDTVQPFDMFPQTVHVESLVLLTKIR